MGNRKENRKSKRMKERKKFTAKENETLQFNIFSGIRKYIDLILFVHSILS